jgi:ATP-dependent Lon protease
MEIVPVKWMDEVLELALERVPEPLSVENLAETVAESVAESLKEDTESRSESTKSTTDITINPH